MANFLGFMLCIEVLRNFYPMNFKMNCKTKASFIVSLVLIHHSRMALLSVNIDTVDIGLTLLAHSHLPQKFWDFAFETAVYLINRLPTLSFQFLSPFQVLHGSPPDYRFLRGFWLPLLSLSSSIYWLQAWFSISSLHLSWLSISISWLSLSRSCFWLFIHCQYYHLWWTSFSISFPNIWPGYS